MKRKIHAVYAALVAILVLFSCNGSGKEKDCPQITPVPTPLRERVLTAKEQAALTPDAVIKSLKEGNKRFSTNNVTARDHSAMVRNAAPGQFPKAVILSCLDSRIPVEDVFDRGIGDLFVGRVAGNFANTDLLGSMEFGCKLMGAKVILVLGHESCGAITATIDDAKLGNITAMLTNIKPAVTASQNFKGEKTSKNKEYVAYVSKNNVINTIKTIRERSPILKGLEDNGQIKIIGGYYDMHTGTVTYL
ncbi:carbonic anhydrase family protein [Flavobacterium sp. LM4]|uniref:carbonic anhydrase family protein n=1 Tax=Flavobacterium sp. LM4 TaxID=1938609 RepID=UPI000993F4EB|nr:carbonic anhydrase family protein [Flavobacterium sp. LM4]OOV19129.1 carbonic anhydrase [Flavobacterium sp. LM4]